MDDLVKRLREDAERQQTWDYDPFRASDLEVEAADRIEALEKALKWYAEHCQKGGDDIEGPSGDYGQRAICALKGEEFCDEQ